MGECKASKMLVGKPQTQKGDVAWQTLNPKENPNYTLKGQVGWEPQSPKQDGLGLRLANPKGMTAGRLTVRPHTAGHATVRK